MAETAQQRLLLEALELEAEGYRALLAGRDEDGRRDLGAAASLYRRSWEAAPARAFGRLVGMLKTAVLAGDAEQAAQYARRELGEVGDSPASWYAIGLAALISGEDELAALAAAGMGGEEDAFARTAEAIAAIAAADRHRYRAAVGAIVADFESRQEHLTGVAFADTALVLERLAERRGMAAGIESAVLPGRA